jgi:hypothetical protein
MLLFGRCWLSAQEEEGKLELLVVVLSLYSFYEFTVINTTTIAKTFSNFLLVFCRLLV